MNDIQQEAAKLLKELDIGKLKDETKRTDILLQKQLQELMLTYVIDIKKTISTQTRRCGKHLSI